MNRITALFITLCVLTASLFTGTVSAETSANVALGKKVTASSQYSDSYSASKIVDGKYNTSWARGTVQLNDKWNNMEFASVDLGTKYDITKIIAYSRQDIDQPSSRKGWIVYGANDENFNDAVKLGTKTSEGEMGSTLELVFDVPETFRHIIIASAGSIVVSELEVYGDVAPEFVEGEFADVEKNIDSQIRLVNCLGIMDGVSAGEFGVNKLMRRGEAAEAVVKMMKIECSDSDSGFSDVDSKNKYSSYIAAARSMGYVSSADTFRPDQFITVTEFLKIILSAMNYNTVLEHGVYPYNVLNLARDLKLLSNTDCRYEDDYVSRQAAAGIIYNALLAKELSLDSISEGSMFMSRRGSILESVYKYSLIRGILTENNVTSLVSPKNNSIGTISINDKQFWDRNDLMRFFIGKAVIAVVNDDDEIICGWEDLKRTNTLTVYGDEIRKSNLEGLQYYKKSEKVKSVRYVDGIPVLKNGVAFSNVEFSNLVGLNGKIELIDNNNDGIYDVIHIFEPEIIISNTVYENEDELSISSYLGNDLYIKDYNSCDIFKEGRPFGIENISEGYLVYAYVSENKKSIRIECLNESISGEVTGISDSELNIDEAVYETTNYFDTNITQIKGFGIGYRGSFVLDERGRIVWVKNADIVNKGNVLAFIRGIYSGSALSGAKISVFENGELKDYETKYNIKVDGIKKNKTELIGLADRLCGEMVYLKVNNEKLISAISTSVTEDKLKFEENDAGSAKVYKTSDAIYFDDSMVLCIDKNIPVYIVPVYSNDMPITDETYNEYYRETSIDNIYKNNSGIGNGKLRFYNQDETGKADFVVHFKEFDVNQDNVNTIQTNEPAMVVENVRFALGEDGDTCFRIYGYDLSTARAVVYNVRSIIDNVVDTYKIQAEQPKNIHLSTYKYVSMSSDLTGYMTEIKNLEPGDIIRYELKDGIITALDRVYAKNNDLPYGQIYSAGSNNTTIISQFRLYKAVCSLVKNNIAKLEMEPINAHNFVKLSSIEGELLVVESGKVKKESYLNFSNVCKENSDFVLFLSSGVVKAIVVYNN